MVNNEIPYPYLIIGTGPTGIAAGAALIDRGLRPMFIDSAELTENRVPTAKSIDVLGPLTGSSSTRGTAKKAWFGDHSVYQPHADSITGYDLRLQAKSANGIGGFSRVWGATFDFPAPSKLWPSDCFPDLIDFQSVRDLIPNSVTTWNVQSANEVLGSPLIGKIFNRMRKVPSKSWNFTPSRLAINSVDKSRSCVACGLCITGCPSDSIWYAGDVLGQWLQLGKADLLSGYLVHSVAENKDFVEILTSKNGSSSVFTAGHVLVAAGAIGTAAIILKSFPEQIGSVEIPETTAVFTAGFSLGSENLGVPRHALSQLWLSKGDFMAQMYGPDKGNVERLISRARWLRFFKPLLGILVSRMVPFICYVRQEDSSSLIVRLDEGKIVVGVGSPANRRGIMSSLSSLARWAISFGIFFPWFVSEVSEAGSAYHSGASLPMGKDTDSLGRLIYPKLKRVSIVDSSVLPEIRVGSITPTAMANAHRIGRLV